MPSIGMQAGLVHFTRSASGRLAKAGINLYCLCPQFVDTPLVANVKRLGQSMPEMGSQLLTPQRVHSISYYSPCLIICIYQNTDVSFDVASTMPGLGYLGSVMSAPYARKFCMAYFLAQHCGNVSVHTRRAPSEAAWLAQVVEASLLLLEDESAHGKVLMVHASGRLYEWVAPKGNLKEAYAGSTPGTDQHSSLPSCWAS